MNKNDRFSISIVVPVYNGETTIAKTFECLLSQTRKPDQLIIINDASTDNSLASIKKYLDGKISYELRNHNERKGLASNYNEAIMASSGELIVTVHQDVTFGPDALRKLIAPMAEKTAVASGHWVSHPLEIWNSYNFWEKCFFARLAGKNFSGIDGKFDCFRKSALAEAGLFDEKRFKSAGEDGDMIFRLKKIGKVVLSDAKIIHLHKISPDFSWKDIINKQKQYSEAQGALFRLGRIRNFKGIIKSFFREMIVIGFFIPYLQILSLVMMIIYVFSYTKIMFLKHHRDKRIIMLPLINIYLLLISLAYSLKGFIYKKQTL